MNLYPSPAIVVRADTPIKIAVGEMQRRSVGSVLVVSDRGDRELVGIFTERDLLKQIHLLVKGSHWNKPIRTIMTHPVQTLGVDEFDQAPARMLQGGFRHLPVTYQDSDGKRRLAGMLSMRDLFQAFFLQREKPKTKETPKALSLGVLTEDGGLFRFLRTSLTAIAHGEVERIPLRGGWPEGEALRTLEQHALVIVDLDQSETKGWATFLRVLLRTKVPKIFLLFDPTQHSEAELDVLSKLDNSERIAAFSKPLNVFALMDRLAP